MGFGYLEVDHRGRLVAAYLEHADHEIAARQGIPTLRSAVESVKARPCAELCVELFRDEHRFVKTLGIDIVEGELGVLEGLQKQDVADDIAEKHRAPRADDGDLGHECLLSLGVFRGIADHLTPVIAMPTWKCR